MQKYKNQCDENIAPEFCLQEHQTQFELEVFLSIRILLRRPYKRRLGESLREKIIITEGGTKSGNFVQFYFMDYENGKTAYPWPLPIYL